MSKKPKEPPLSRETVFMRLSEGPPRGCPHCQQQRPASAFWDVRTKRPVTWCRECLVEQRRLQREFKAAAQAAAQAAMKPKIDPPVFRA